MVMKKKRTSVKKDKAVSKVSGPQGPVSRESNSAVSPKNKGALSFVLGTSTNKSPAIRSAVPKAKGSKKK